MTVCNDLLEQQFSSRWNARDQNIVIALHGIIASEQQLSRCNSERRRYAEDFRRYPHRVPA